MEREESKLDGRPVGGSKQCRRDGMVRRQGRRGGNTNPKGDAEESTETTRAGQERAQSGHTAWGTRRQHRTSLSSCRLGTACSSYAMYCVLRACSNSVYSWSWLCSRSHTEGWLVVKSVGVSLLAAMAARVEGLGRWSTLVRVLGEHSGQNSRA
jgi:hypothetical protein